MMGGPVNLPRGVALGNGAIAAGRGGLSMAMFEEGVSDLTAAEYAVGAGEPEAEAPEVAAALARLRARGLRV